MGVKGQKIVDNVDKLVYNSDLPQNQQSDCG